MNTLQSAKNTTRATRVTLSLLDDILGAYSPCNFNIRLWDGTLWKENLPHEVDFTLVLRHPGSLRKMFLPPSELRMAEAYIYDDFDIEGNIESIFPVATHLLEQKRSLASLLKSSFQLLLLPNRSNPQVDQKAQLHGQPHSKDRDRHAISYHYDRSNEFYKLFLDERLIYSCAYFESNETDLDSAQEKKLDYICRKLRLSPGERLLDIGCGWGGLVMYAAQNYGVEAYGITLSHQQAELAQERIQKAGLAERCKVEIRDYRELATEHSVVGTYDKIVSVGMFEHVGKTMLTTYFKEAWKLLRPGGSFLNHGIASSHSIPLRPGPEFMAKYVFPDGELVPISTTLEAAEINRFEVRDVESLREHYMLTLRHWVQRLEAEIDEVQTIAGDLTYRVWRLYMAGMAFGFKTGRLNIYQSLLIKPDNCSSNLPLTRNDWYLNKLSGD